MGFTKQLMWFTPSSVEGINLNGKEKRHKEHNVALNILAKLCMDKFGPGVI